MKGDKKVIEYAPGQEMRSANTEREVMPVASDGKR